ncbi:MAG: acetate kinase [Deltaproteobacteria bacterium]|nr:acetate kinase [Deltaproteobacteria bacterium]MBW2537419.1 acetate kinase [Deltaproteobacteria bacterium]
MKVLVINSGSSSIKYQLLAMPAGEVIAKGLVQRIGEPEGKLEQHAGGHDVEHAEPIVDHARGLERLVQLLTEGEHGPLDSVEAIGAVGHRVVHGGEHFKESALIDDEVVRAIEDHSELAPLHNPPNLLGIQVARKLLPEVPQVAVFDTAFHQTLPPHAFRYALPKSFYADDRVRRYGFHGTSHKYVAGRAAELLGKPLDGIDLITCHLGNGASMAAIARGRVVDTTMGLTPLEGLVMGTRCGDIDPAIIFHMARARSLSIDELDRTLNKQSGLLGISGSSNDVRELLDKSGAGDEDAALALDVYCYRIKKYVGAYLAVLGRLDALVFTAGVGENSPAVRSKVCAGLDGLGIAIDPSKNDWARGETDVSAAGVASKVLVIPTNEEKLIATDTFALASGVGG